MREINYSCGCKLGESGISICPLHFVIFEELLPVKYYVYDGWHNLDQNIYNKIIHCLNVDEKNRLEG